MKRIKSFIELTRPGNVAITGFSVLIGTGGGIGAADILKIAGAVASAMLIAAGGNAQNDYYDQKIDAINRPDRPIPSGRISSGTAQTFSVIAYTLGAAIGWSFGPELGAVSTLVALLLWLYAAKGKALGLAGNLLIATVCGLAFIYGGLAVRNPVLAVFPAVFALLMHLAREIVKDVQDISGDRAAGARTVAITAGIPNALRYSAYSLLILVTVSPLPYLMGIYNIRYLIAVILGVDLVLLPIIFKLIRDPLGVDCAKTSLILKIDMLAGLMAIALGI